MAINFSKLAKQIEEASTQKELVNLGEQAAKAQYPELVTEAAQRFWLMEDAKINELDPYKF